MEHKIFLHFKENSLGLYAFSPIFCGCDCIVVNGIQLYIVDVSSLLKNIRLKIFILFSGKH